MLYKDEVYAIQGAIFEVYKEMGNAWHEEVYQQCMERELGERGIPFDSKKNWLFVHDCGWCLTIISRKVRNVRKGIGAFGAEH